MLKYVLIFSLMTVAAHGLHQDIEQMWPIAVEQNEEIVQRENILDLGKPIFVTRYVWLGTRFTFTFRDGTQVLVRRWWAMNVFEITDVIRNAYECCKERTVECLSCTAGLTPEQYCSTDATLPGCPEDAGEAESGKRLYSKVQPLEPSSLSKHHREFMIVVMLIFTLIVFTALKTCGTKHRVPLPQWKDKALLNDDYVALPDEEETKQPIAAV